jgi:hypothetical protein
LWHLGHAYQDDYELVRNDDRFKFFLAFYQDPYPETTGINVDLLTWIGWPRLGVGERLCQDRLRMPGD